MNRGGRMESHERFEAFRKGLEIHISPRHICRV